MNEERQSELIDDGIDYRNGFLRDDETLLYNNRISYEEMMWFLAGYTAKSHYTLEYGMFERIMNMPSNGEELKSMILNRSAKIEEVQEAKFSAGGKVRQKEEAYNSIW